MKYPTAHLMNASAIALFVSLSMAGLPSSAQTPDSRNPSQETVCDGLDAYLFGICNAYCEVMDCDSPDHEASDKACLKKIQKWSNIAGDNPLPCNEYPRILLTKTVNAGYPSFEITEGDQVVYTFVISNVGNVPVVLTELFDPMIPGALDDCAMALIGQTLEISASLTCVSDLNEIAVVNDTVTNTPTILGVSIYGTPVSGEAKRLFGCLGC